MVDKGEDVGFGAGVVAAQALEVLVGLKGVALAAQDVAVEDKAAGQPVVVRRIGVDEVVDDCFGPAGLPAVKERL